MSRFIALDFETSGLDPNRHAPVSIGIAIFEDGHPTGESLEGLIGPTTHWKTGKVEREYTVAALEVSGIKWADIKKAAHPKAVVADIATWAKMFGCSDLPIVAFNAPFDFAFYSQLLYMASDWHPTERGVKIQPVPPLCGPWYCAKMLARRELDLSNYSLDDVAARFGLARESEKHSALEDAVLAGRVFHALSGVAASQFITAGTAPEGGE